jgi:hypothetical protein
MLSWSRGMKKELTGQEELTDEEAMALEMPAETVAGHINSEALSVLHARRLLPNFLAYVAEYCANQETAQSDIDAYVDFARTTTKVARGDVKVKMHSRGFMHVDQEKNHQK